MWDMDKFDAIQISIASPEKIRSWSYGEVKKPETINYRTHKPERDGLFCERIFGPQKSWECFCGKYKSIRYKGIICERCNVEITKSSVRRERMGHIQLVSPVAHIWYCKGSPNYIALLLDISARDLEKVLYFQSYIVIDPGNLPLSKKQLLPEEGTGGEMGYRELREKYGDMFVAKMGAEAIKELLAEIDLKKLETELSAQLKVATGAKRAHILKRLELVKWFANSISRPEWMIIEVLPVLPPDLRPMVQLDGGRFATSDLNDLYRRVINRNNRLKRLIKLQAPDIIIKNEKRMLQEAVNALIDNGRRGKLVTGPNNRPLKSLTDMLKGKQGRFRQNLLGKRVDYSGRSVIVVGPTLKLHQAGLPKKMALELFKPFVMHKLVSKGLAHNIKSAKKMIEREKPEVWDVLEEVIKHHPILLNRAPTLHRLGIQAFEPILIEGKAIQIHPLVCTAYNADFDGDQMAVHVPLLLDAQIEARLLMLSTNNILKPADGRPITHPTQDMTIGIFYLTIEKPEDINYPVLKLTCPNGIKWEEILLNPSRPFDFKLAKDITNDKGQVIIEKGFVFDNIDAVQKINNLSLKEIWVYKPPIFSTIYEAINAYEQKHFPLQQPILIHRSAFPQGKINHLLPPEEPANKKSYYLKTTIGRLIFNEAFPMEFPYQNSPVRKEAVNDLIKRLFNNFPLDIVSVTLDRLKELGFRYATLSGLTISLVDLVDPPKKHEIIERAEKNANKIKERFNKGEINRDERRQAEINIWTKATEDVSDDLLEIFESTAKAGNYNPVYMMAFSGARGNMQQIRQLAAMRGLMSNPKGDILPFPIKSNFREGLNQTEYFISTYGARKGLVDTALRTADSGYLTRRLVDVAQDVVVTIDDCKTPHGIEIYPIRQSRSSNNILVDDIVVPLRYRIAGRVLAKDAINPLTGNVVTVVYGNETYKLTAGLFITDELASEIESISEMMVSIDQVKPGMIIAEQVIDPKTNRVIIRPDRPLNKYVIDKLKEAQINEIKIRIPLTIRSPLTCRAKMGICRMCYGSDLATGKLVDVGEAVGIIAAQSIGEPGTQLTMRTFHLGGVALAQRSYVKARSAGVVNLSKLKLAKVHDRSKFEIGSGTETFDKSEFGANLREVVVGGYVVIEGKGGRKDRIHIPVGADLKVKDGDKVTPGKPIAEYNPNYVVSGYTGEVIFDNIEIKDGMVVSEDGVIQIVTQEFDQEKKEFIVEQYKIPQGATLRVEDGDIIHAGNILAEVSAEQHAAISRIDGIVKFENIKIKNKQVISDSGMIYVFPENTDPLKDRFEYPLPKAVKEIKDLIENPGGIMLNVRSGDVVQPGEKLLSVVSEMDGIVTITNNNTLFTVTKDTVEEFELRGTLEAKIDQKNKELTLIAPMSGIVRVIGDKSQGNKSIDRKRLIIKNEVEYPIPKGVILRPKEHCKVTVGQEITEGTELTTKLYMQSEIDGIVEISRIKAEKRVNLILDDINIIKNSTLARPLINKETEKELAPTGTVIDDNLFSIIDEAKSEIREIYIVAGETDAVIVRGEKHVLQYPVPQNAKILVEDGQVVKAGDKIVDNLEPIKSEITGKVNFIYGYNKILCEEVIEKILVYSGIEFTYPATLNFKFAKTVTKGSEITLEPIKFEEIVQLDPDTDNATGGILIKQRVNIEKKYKITKDMLPYMQILVTNNQPVREGQILAVMTSKNSGVVLLEHASESNGKAKSSSKIVVQTGEAYQIMDGAELRVEEGQKVKKGEILAKWGIVGRKTTDIIQGLPRVAELFEVRKPKKEAVIAEECGFVKVTSNSISIVDPATNVEKPVRVQFTASGLVVHDGEYIEAGDPITDGKVFPKKLVRVVGLPVARRYLIDEIQRVYREQGVSINDKHLEIIARQMLRKVTITDPGDSDFLPNETVHVKAFEDKVHKLIQEKKKPPVGIPIIQGITKASLTTDSFISAASFQETTRVLTKAAIKSKIDYLRGLKENLIIGKLIPAGTGLAIKRKIVFKNLPVEVEKIDTSDATELFMNEPAPEEEELKKLEESLFLKKPLEESDEAR